MAECVSCGKEIPAGKFFCDACYVKMKGRRGSLKGVPQVSVDRRQVESKDEAEIAGAKPQKEPADPEGVITDKKASGSLTPASGKKVVSMKQSIDKDAMEKAGKKKFTVTITFSERTYEALSRLKRKKEVQAEAVDGEVGETSALPARPQEIKGKKLHRRPRLKAVAGASDQITQQKGGFMRLIERRNRA